MKSEESEELKESNVFPLKLELDSGIRTFTSASNFMNWIDGEVEFFDWLNVSIQSDPKTRYIHTAVNQWLNQIKNVKKQFETKSNDPKHKEKNIENLKNQVNAAKTRGILVTSNSPKAIYSKNLVDLYGDIVATYTLGSLLSLEPPKPNSNTYRLRV